MLTWVLADLLAHVADTPADFLLPVGRQEEAEREVERERQQAQGEQRFD
jgi:hypothetical protein